MEAVKAENHEQAAPTLYVPIPIFRQLIRLHSVHAAAAVVEKCCMVMTTVELC
jgi:hypothetical protein